MRCFSLLVLLHCTAELKESENVFALSAMRHGQVHVLKRKWAATADLTP